MRFKKRYILFFLPLAFIGVMKLEFLAFRQSEAKQEKFFKEQGVEDYSFHQYEVDGKTMHYTHVGDEGKPLAILVHGSPGSSSAYMSYLVDRELASFAQIVSVDRPGFGYSDFGNAERSVEEQARMIREIIDLHPAEEVLLVGHSYGGPVVARMAMDFPEEIDGIVMVAGSIDPELEPREWWRKPLDWKLVRWMIPTSFRVCNQEILPLYEELQLMLPLWERIICPVIVVQGDKDKLVPPGNADFAGRMAMNSSQLDIHMIEEGDHFILWSKQDMIVGLMKDLVSKKEPVH